MLRFPRFLHLIVAALPAACPFFVAEALPAAELSGVKVESKPFVLQTDVGKTPAEQQKTAAKFLRPITETANFFLKVYELKGTCFEDYASFYDRPPEQHFEKLIRVRIWRNYDDFLADYQKRYKTKSLPAAFFGINRQVDDYGKEGDLIREIGTSTEGDNDQQVLRHLYHEMGHLFMRTFIVRQCEVPSWIEEGTAELFQYRKGNGTKPEAERDQREGWLTEMVAEGTSIPWQEMVNVHNLDNLDFTYKDPMRSTIQYVQAWSMIEFMVSNQQRQSAFIAMLKKFKSDAENYATQLQGKSPEEFLKIYVPYLYTIQEAAFEKCYGNKLLSIEANWKEWIKKTYDTEVKKHPILRYHRGEWYVLRARNPRMGEAAKDLLAKAETIFNECVQLNPDKPEGYVGLGRLALTRGDLKAAEEGFSKALGLGSESYDALLYAGIARVLGGRCKDAIDPLTKAVEQRPTDAEGQRYLGQALAAGGGDPELALSHLRAARDLDANQAPNCAFIEGGVQYIAGHASDAYISWLRTANLRSDFPMIQVYQAMAKAANNLPDDALELLKPIETTAVGKAFHDLIAAGKPLPKMSFTVDGWPTIDWAAAGLRTAGDAGTNDGAPDAKEKDSKAKTGEKPSGELDANPPAEGKDSLLGGEQTK